MTMTGNDKALHTKDGRPLAVGMRIQDNDPRVSFVRVLLIVGFVDGKVRAQGLSGRTVCISPQRIFADGKPRHTGFRVLPDGG